MVDGTDETLDALAGTVPSEPRAPNTSGLPPQIGRFQILGRLGAGGMGAVLLASDPTLARKVAIKVLRDRGAGSEAQRRLVREAQAMAQLSHENVIVVHEVGMHEAQVYVAMEYVAGTTLGKWQAGRSASEVIAMYSRVGEGLAAAHAAGLVHRDFKPDNVLVGTDGRVRVSDFGLVSSDGAVVTEAPGHTTELAVSLTRSGAVMGTPRYMAPEQFRAEEVDARADQFAFCVALYEALFLERPFDGEDYAALCENVTNGRLRPAPASRVAPAIRAALVRGLAVDARERFPSMRELLDVLRASSRPRRRWLAPAIAGGVLTCGIGLYVALTGHAESPPRVVDASVTPVESRAERDARLASLQQQFDLASMAYVSGTYAEAAKRFADAYAFAGYPQLLYDAAASSLMAGDMARAREQFAQYLREDPQAPDRPAVEALIAARAAPATAPALRGLLIVDTVPPGAEIVIDEMRRPIGTSPWSGWLEGKHAIALSLAGRPPVTVPVSIRPGQVFVLKLDF